MTRVARAEGPGPSDNFIPRPEITRRVLSAVAAADGEVISEQESVPSADAALSTGNELISARSEDNSDSPEVEIEGSSVEEAETGDFEWDDEEDSEALRQARKDAEMVASTDGVRTYLKTIGKVALLKAEEEVDLAKRIEAGLYGAELLRRHAEEGAEISPQRRRDLNWIVRDGERAKNHLLEANLRLVVSIAKRYTGRGMAFLDLIQEGNLGLIRAVEKFDYTKGYKFSTYASWWVRQAVSRALHDQSRSVRLPVHVSEVVVKMERITRELTQDLDREPTPEEVAAEMNITTEKLEELREWSRQVISLDQKVGDKGEATLGEFIEDESVGDVQDFIQPQLTRDALDHVLATLNERERDLVILRFGLDGKGVRTLDQIGTIFRLSRERVRQIESKTMAKLQHPSRMQSLRGLLNPEDGMLDAGYTKADAADATWH